MDKTKSPGIALENVNLLACNVQVEGNKEELKFALAITGLKRVIAEDGKLLIVQVNFDMMHKVPDPSMTFTCAFGAVYSRGDDSNMSWDEFKDHMALAHLVPFVREFVSNITTRMPLVPLMLPPVNTFQLLRNYAESKKASEPDARANPETKPAN